MACEYVAKDFVVFVIGPNLVSVFQMLEVKHDIEIDLKHACGHHGNHRFRPSIIAIHSIIEKNFFAKGMTYTH